MVSRIGGWGIVCWLVVAPASGLADDPSFQFLRTEAGARAAALGGALVSVVDDPAAVFYNPAGLGGVDRTTGTVTFLDHMLDFWVLVGSVVYPLNGRDRLGFGINYVSYGEFDGRDENNLSTGGFSAQDYALTLSYGATVRRHVFLGAGVKYIRSDIGGISADALAGDAGLVVRIPVHQLNIGVSLANMGRQRDAFLSTREEVPGHAKLGVSKVLAHLPVMLSGEFRRYTNSDVQLMGGAEFRVGPAVRLRAGYNSDGRDQQFGFGQDRLAGFALGAGLLFDRFTLDYALTFLGAIGYQNRFTLSSHL